MSIVYCIKIINYYRMNKEKEIKEQMLYLINLDKFLEGVYRYIAANNKLDMVDSYKIKQKLNHCKDLIGKLQKKLQDKVTKMEYRKCKDLLCNKSFEVNVTNKLKMYCDRSCKENAKIKTKKNIKKIKNAKIVKVKADNFKNIITDYPSVPKLESLISFIQTNKEYVIKCRNKIKNSGGTISYVALSCFVGNHCKEIIVDN